MIKKIRLKIFFYLCLRNINPFQSFVGFFPITNILSMIEVGLICKMFYKIIPIFHNSVGSRIFTFSPE
ncbi:hypothetical protein C0J52_23162 [Blattella germanica]|nr:hypothetical protein C0J52_23162 [Blattella germanica]